MENKFPIKGVFIIMWQLFIKKNLKVLNFSCLLLFLPIYLTYPKNGSKTSICFMLTRFKTLSITFFTEKEVQIQIYLDVFKIFKFELLNPAKIQFSLPPITAFHLKTL